MKRIKIPSTIIRSVIALTLVLLFSGSGSCRVKKAFFSVSDGSVNKELIQKDFSTKRGLLSVSCNNTNNLLSQNLSLPEPAVIAPPAPTHFLTVLSGFNRPSPDERYYSKYNQKLFPVYPDSVPVYLRKRYLLI